MNRIKDQQPNNKPVDKIRELLTLLTEMDLRSINELVVNRLKLIEKTNSILELSNFCIGDTVYFNRDDDMVVGVVKRLNQKTISIETDGGEQWNVSSRLLRRYVKVN